MQHNFSCFLHVTELLSTVYFGLDYGIDIVFLIALCVCFMYCSLQGEEELHMTPFIFMSYVCLVTALDSSVWQGFVTLGVVAGNQRRREGNIILMLEFSCACSGDYYSAFRFVGKTLLI